MVALGRGGVSYDLREEVGEGAVEVLGPVVLHNAFFLPTHHNVRRGTPAGRSRYQTLEFPSTLEFPTELPTHAALVPDSRDGVPVEALQRGQGPNPRQALCGSF